MCKLLRRISLFAALLIPSLGRAATAPAVTVSSTAVAGSTVTVTTAAAHGLAVNQGFCNFTAAAPYCGVVTAVGSGTTFSFTETGAAACATACGAVTPAKRVIWLQTNTVAGGYQVNYLLWLTTTQPVPSAGKSSGWSGASTAENAALAAGYFIEVGRSAFFPLGTTLGNAQAQMANDWSAQQTQLAASVQPGQFFGDWFDGTGWVQ